MPAVLLDVAPDVAGDAAHRIDAVLRDAFEVIDAADEPVDVLVIAARASDAAERVRRAGGEAPVLALVDGDADALLACFEGEAVDVLPLDAAPVRLRHMVARLAAEHRRARHLRRDAEAGRHALATLRHDVRGAVNALVGYAALLADALDEDDEAAARRDAERLDQVARGILPMLVDTVPAQPPSAPDAPAAPSPAEPPASPIPAAPLVLVVDDEPDSREVVTRLLTHAGFRTLEAAEGAAGLDLARRHRPDVVLLDVVMPEVDGWAVLEALRREGAPPPPVVMLTGRGDEHVAARAFREGANDYLVKGALTAEALRRSVRTVIEKARLRHALDEARHALAEANETLEQRVEEQTGQIRRLAARLTLAEQYERERIAAVLHDHLQQHLYGVNMRVQMLRGRAPGDDAAFSEPLEQVERLVSEAIAMARSLTVELSPPVLEGDDLSTALRWLALRMDETHGLDVEIEAEQPCSVPRRAVRVLLFRVVRELLFNVVKHAGVERARLALRCTQRALVVEVADRGRGFDASGTADASAGGWGLGSVRERLALFEGRLELDTAPGRGTRALVTVPRAMLAEDPPPPDVRRDDDTP